MKKIKNKNAPKNLESLGRKGNQENRLIALKSLDVLTKKRENLGYVWIKKGTTNKQIHPDKLQQHLEDGWKKTKK